MKLVDRIIKIYKSNKQETGLYKKTVWRMTGYTCNSDAAGTLELGEHASFDGCANSLSVRIYLRFLEEDHQNMKLTIERAFKIYNGDLK
jgi:hypothetical protein